MAHLTNTNSHNTACCRELQCTCLVQDADGAAAPAKRRCTEYIYMGLRDRKNEKKRKERSKGWSVSEEG